METADLEAHKLFKNSLTVCLKKRIKASLNDWYIVLLSCINFYKFISSFSKIKS